MNKEVSTISQSAMLFVYHVIKLFPSVQSDASQALPRYCLCRDHRSAASQVLAHSDNPLLSELSQQVS